MPSQNQPRFRYEPLIATVVLFALAALACAPMLWLGASNGHSIIYNLVWMKDFAAQLAQGDWYPRWLMHLNHGAGSPVFYFYGPLPFYIAAVPALLLAGSKLTIQLAFAEWLLIALSGLAFYRYARGGSFGVASSFICAALYMVLPYHFEIDLWRRQDLGELANYIWMPLLLYYTDKTFEGREALVGLAIVYALLMLSHLPSALLFSIALGCYVLVTLWHQRSCRYLHRFVAALGLGIALTGIYWVPALFSEQYVRADQLWTPYFDYHRWFFPVEVPPDSHSRAFVDRLFSVISTTTIMFAMFWLVAFRWREKKLWGALALVAIAWFLMSRLSVSIWEMAPQLWKVQFPWRIAMVIDLATAMAALHAAHCWHVHRDRFSAIASVVALGLLGACFYTADVRHTLDPYDHQWWVAGRDQAVRNGLDAPEYTTRWNPSREDDTSAGIAGLPPIAHDPAAGSVAVTRWAPRDIELSVDLQHPAAITVRQFYFPNWRARTDGGELLATAPLAENGLLKIAAPAGSYRLQLRMVALPQEFIGAGISLSGIILLLLWSVWRRRKHRNDYTRTRSAAARACPAMPSQMTNKKEVVDE